MIYRDSWYRKFWNSRRCGKMCLLVCLAAGLASASCSRREESRAGTDYPQPRYPRYLVNPNVDELLEKARFAVRQPTGRSPLGKIQSGQTVHVLLQWGQDMAVWEAVRQAWAEKGVEAHALGIWEVLGITKEEYEQRMTENVVLGSEGWKEAGLFLREDYRQFFSDRDTETVREPGD